MFNHTLHTISIDRFSLMIESEDKRLASRFKYLPKKLIEHNHTKLMTDFSMEINKSAVKSTIDRNFLKLYYWNQFANYLPLIRLGIILNKKAAIEEYEKVFKKKPTGLSDVKAIDDRIKTYKAKYESEVDKSDGNKEFDFEELVNSVEEIRQVNIDRKLKVYQFLKIYFAAKKKIQILKEKHNGRH